MKPENRLDHLAERTRALLRFGLGQKRMVDPEEFTPGLMHVFIFAAFLVLRCARLMLFAMGFSIDALEVLSDLTAPVLGAAPGAARRCIDGYLLVKDLVAALGASLGVALLLLPALQGEARPADAAPGRRYLILGFIGGLMVTEFIFGASHLVRAAAAGFTRLGAGHQRGGAGACARCRTGALHVLGAGRASGCT